MNIYIICTILSIFAKITFTTTVEESLKAFRAAAVECRQNFTITSEEWNKFKKDELLSSHNGKCYETCVMKKTGIMTPDNKVSKEGFLLSVSLVSPKDDTLTTKLAGEVYELCAEVTDADECEASHKLGKCLQEGLKNKGL